MHNSNFSASLAGTLSPACQRSILVLSTGMLMFVAKIYQIPDLNDLMKTLVPYDVSFTLCAANQMPDFLLTFIFFSDECILNISYICFDQN